MNYRMMIMGVVILFLLPQSAQAAETLIYRHHQQNGRSILKTVAPELVDQLPEIDRLTVQPNYAYHASFTPNDPQFGLQWDFNVINVPSAWDAGATPPFIGNSAVIVAVLDTGVAYTTAAGRLQNPDMASMVVWTNPNEVAGDNIDNDSNGLIDDVNGWNYIGQNNLPLDDYGHGTHIAGIITAGMNNGIATAGIAPGVTMMPIKVLDDEGNGSTLTIAQGIDYAANNGVRVINLSLGGDDDDPILHQSIVNARAKGVLVVAASGNEYNEQINYPARYPETISVGATQYDNTRAPYSNYGPGLMVIAPGGNTNVDQNGDGQPDGIAQETCTTGDCTAFGTYYYSGTSQAAAHVTAAVALIESCGALTDNVLPALTSTAVDLGQAGYDQEYGHGLINIRAALSQVGCSSTAPEAVTNLNVRASSAGVTLTSTRSYPYKSPYLSWSGSSDVVYQLQWGLEGATPTVTTQTSTTFRPTIKKNGAYLLKVTVSDSLGRTSPTINLRYQYRAAQIIISEQKKVRILKSTGADKSNIKLPTASQSYRASGTTADLSGDDQLFISSYSTGRVDIRQSSGKVIKQWHPFGKKYNQGIDGGIIKRQNMSPLYLAVAANGAEARWLDSDGKKILGLTLGNGKVKGLRTAIGDFDGDNNDEVIIADAHGPAIRLYQTDGTIIGTVKPLGAKYTGGWAVAVGDVDGSGTSTILALPLNARKSPAIYSISATAETLGAIRLKGLNSTAPFDFTAVDYDGNGRAEIVVLTPDSRDLTVWDKKGKKLKTLQMSSAAVNARIGRLE